MGRRGGWRTAGEGGESETSVCRYTQLQYTGSTVREVVRALELTQSHDLGDANMHGTRKGEGDRARGRPTDTAHRVQHTGCSTQGAAHRVQPTGAKKAHHVIKHS